MSLLQKEELQSGQRVIISSGRTFTTNFVIHWIETFVRCLKLFLEGVVLTQKVVSWQNNKQTFKTVAD